MRWVALLFLPAVLLLAAVCNGGEEDRAALFQQFIGERW